MLRALVLAATVLSQEQLLQRGLAAQQLRDVRVRQHFQQRRDRAAHLARTTRPSTCTELTPGTPDRSGTGPSKVASTVSALRCLIWASVPISTSLPSRKMATRSHSASTSLMMCEDRKTVWPRSDRKSVV